MNSRIKFRVWNGKSFDTKGVYIKQDGSCYDYEEDYGGTFSSHEKLYPYKCVIQQCTGLKDSNEKEIFEGDIVEWEENSIVAEVYWEYENAGFAIRSENGGALLNEEYALEYTVIGNIFENSDLLLK